MHGRKRIALYGGTFDPIHKGHLEVARRSIELFEISELLFIPARQAPHKLAQDVTAPIHRYAMLALATQHEPKQVISTFEMDAPGRCYTIDTIKHFRSVYDHAELFFIMGADSWAEITTWRDWQGLMQATNLIVVTRPGYDMKIGMFGSTEVSVADVRGCDRVTVNRTLNDSTRRTAYLTDIAMVDVSATTIRTTVAAGGSELEAFVPTAVSDYIEKYRLYKNSHEN